MSVVSFVDSSSDQSAKTGPSSSSRVGSLSFIGYLLFAIGYHSGAPLAGAAFGADSAGSGADDFAAAAVRAGGVHIHVAEGGF